MLGLRGRARTTSALRQTRPRSSKRRAPARRPTRRRRTTWWTLFDDPVLNAPGVARRSLRTRICAASEAAYRQASAVVREQRASFFPFDFAVGGGCHAAPAAPDVAAPPSPLVPAAPCRRRRQAAARRATRPAPMRAGRSTSGAACAARSENAHALRRCQRRRPRWRQALSAGPTRHGLSAASRSRRRSATCWPTPSPRTHAHCRSRRTATTSASAGKDRRSAGADPTRKRSGAVRRAAQLQRAQLEHAIASLIGQPAGNYTLEADPSWKTSVPDVPAGVAVDACFNAAPISPQQSAEWRLQTPDIGIQEAALLPFADAERQLRISLVVRRLTCSIARNR